MSRTADGYEREKKTRRWGIRFTGIVQGVGFRPLVSVSAEGLRLTGFVYNDADGVYCEIEGSDIDGHGFAEEIRRRLLPPGRIDSVKVSEIGTIGSSEFSILPSPTGGRAATFVAADTAPCAACVAELTDVSDRRYGYPFINCTHCGPRYTIIDEVPYDRERTSMRDFPMCNACAAEYGDLRGRRYHAEPNACDICGPHYRLTDMTGKVVGGAADPLVCANELIEEGHIVAVKGIGGYHLVCDARNDRAVDTLRERKRRRAKPFAVMAGSFEAAVRAAHIDEAERLLLESPARPIVLLKKRRKAVECMISDSVAPFTGEIGLMLPYAPVHYVLVPKDAFRVMTSANDGGEPLVYEDAAVYEALAELADYVLTHDRRIVSPTDDSVAGLFEGEAYLYRRSRGYVPLSIVIPGIERIEKRLPTILAMGGDLKNVIALNANGQVVPGPYIGDLASEGNRALLEETIRRTERLFDVKPDIIAGDSHPDYVSSQIGRALAAERGIPFVEVNHHHAHVMSVATEWGIEGPVIGVAFDGTGYGPDGSARGGEFLLADAEGYVRLSHAAEAPLPGGEKAVEEPWRQALWYLMRTPHFDAPAYVAERKEHLPADYELIEELLRRYERGEPVPFGTGNGMGRLFDAAACLLGLAFVSEYDGQPAMMLEQAAEGFKGKISDFSYDGTVLDFSPLMNRLVTVRAAGGSIGEAAASFHRTVAYATAEVVENLKRRTGVDRVVLSGGVFQNRRLLAEIRRIWPEERFYIPRKLPANDGGLALGQWRIALSRRRDGSR